MSMRRCICLGVRNIALLISQGVLTILPVTAKISYKYHRLPPPLPPPHPSPSLPPLILPVLGPGESSSGVQLVQFGGIQLETRVESQDRFEEPSRVELEVENNGMEAVAITWDTAIPPKVIAVVNEVLEEVKAEQQANEQPQKEVAADVAQPPEGETEGEDHHEE
ncbi:hypothetical protein Ddye_026146 [Dipteronia dyeriana]|uniref:Uncharacterized protein n=1 Tax=Dipteronia dyeriana TaxID=168575 RepID=A0AAD9TLQ8_9ROSI|nr:hypothetical protein Ddye_026146 [Dipteronia dyeriana]